jgi:hypothetical protein
MPFTFAHPAVIVPLARRWPAWLPLSALVMGSLAPDLIYLCSIPYTLPDQGQDMVAFLGVFPIDQQFGHGWPGMVVVSLSTALALLAFYHAVLKWPLVSLFPPAMRAQLIPVAQAFSWTRVGAVIDPIARCARILVAALIGIATHVLWDGFTHREGWAVDYVPWLQLPVAGQGPSALTVAECLQMACSILGLAVLALWAWVWLRARPAVAPAASAITPWRADRTRVALLTLGALGVVMVAGANGLWTFHRMGGPLRFHGGISVVGLWIVRLPAAILVVYAMYWWAVVGRKGLATLRDERPSALTPVAPDMPTEIS